MRVHRRFALAFCFGLVTVLGAKCGGEASYLADGDVTGDSAAYRAVKYELTSDNYRRWHAAEAALDSAGVEASVRLDTRHLTDADIERAIAEVEDDSTVKAAIEGAGLSVRDYVLTTIALAQSWDAVNSRDVRVVGLAQRNADFLRSQAAPGDTVQERPRATVFEDDSDRRPRERPGHRKRGRGHGKGHAKRR